jgi:hypothetical protein
MSVATKRPTPPITKMAMIRKQPIPSFASFSLFSPISFLLFDRHLAALRTETHPFLAVR